MVSGSFEKDLTVFSQVFFGNFPEREHANVGMTF